MSYIDNYISIKLKSFAERPLKYTSVIIFILVSTLHSSYAEIIDKVIAAVNGEAITLSALENEIRIQNLSDIKKTKQLDILNKLIDRKLILQESRRMGIDLVITMEEIDAKVDSLKAQYPSEESFLKYLQKEGLTINDIKAEMKESLMISEMLYRKFMYPLNVDSEAFEREAMAYYENNKSKYIEPKKVKLQQIVVLTNPITGGDIAKAISQKVWNKLQQGATFLDIQKIYSENTNVIVDYEPGYIDFDKLIPKLQKEISKLEIGNLSKPILTTRGYFIIKFIDYKPAKQQPFEQVADSIKNELMLKQVQIDLDKWLEKQRESSDIRILYGPADTSK